MLRKKSRKETFDLEFVLDMEAQALPLEALGGKL